MTVTLRDARPDDHAAFTRLFPELAVDDPTPTPATWAAELVPTTVIAEDAGAVVGYLYYQVFAGEGIVRHLVVAPAHHGRRIGQRLLAEVAARLRAAGCTRWSLNVKPDNAAALRLYARVGMTTAYASQALRFGWDLVARLPAPAPSLTAWAVTPAADAEVEAAVRLPAGMLATARALPGRVLRAVTDAAASLGTRTADASPIVGAAVFVPRFPGAYPFRAASPEAARVLLAVLRPHALPEPPYMQVVVEDQPELARALREAGATVRLDILHLEGALPPA